MCAREPGLFRKNGMLLSVYVDDSLICGPDKKQIQAERDLTLKRFPGKIIEPEWEGNVRVRDILGATLRYDQSKRWMKLSMEGAIKRCLAKFSMTDCRPLFSPCTNESISEGPLNSAFPIRNLVGAVQYIATMCRCDIVYAVQRLARCIVDCRDSTVRAGKRVLAYLKATADVGLEYSPENEESFKRLYGKIAETAMKELADTMAFSDSDFAGCTATLRSTSGSILYHRGTPVCWSAKRQTIRATSTCEAEYVGIYDTIKLSLSQGFLDWFLHERELPLVFTDSQSALGLSNAALVTKRSKHIDLRYHVVRDYCKDLAYCPTGVNRADPLTKPMRSDKYLSLFMTPVSEDPSDTFYARAYFAHI